MRLIQISLLFLAAGCIDRVCAERPPATIPVSGALAPAVERDFRTNAEQHWFENLCEGPRRSPWSNEEALRGRRLLKRFFDIAESRREGNHVELAKYHRLSPTADDLIEDKVWLLNIISTSRHAAVHAYQTTGVDVRSDEWRGVWVGKAESHARVRREGLFGEFVTWPIDRRMYRTDLPVVEALEQPIQLPRYHGSVTPLILPDLWLDTIVSYDDLANQYLNKPRVAIVSREANLTLLDLYFEASGEGRPYKLTIGFDAACDHMPVLMKNSFGFEGLAEFTLLSRVEAEWIREESQWKLARCSAVHNNLDGTAADPVQTLTIKSLCVEAKDALLPASIDDDWVSEVQSRFPDLFLVEDL